MVKRSIIAVIVVGIVVGVVVFFKIEKCDSKSVGDVVYEVVEEEDIPREIMDEINGYKSKMDEGGDYGKGMRRASFLCSDEMYIVVFYGEQDTDGYSIEVRELYESKNAIFVETVLMGPKSVKEIKEVKSYPYIVIKIPVSEKQVVFI